MTVVSTKSISGVTSITSPQADDAITLHTNDTTQRVSVTTGGMNVTGVVTATSFSGTASGNATISNNADNRVITGGSGNALNGEANLAYDGTALKFASSQSKINLNTSDGSDNKVLSIHGGGDSSQSRGAGLSLYGNEYTNYQGKLFVMAGNSSNTNGTIDFYTGGLERLRIASTGKIVASTNTTTTASFDYLGLHFTSDNSTVAEGLFINNIAANTGDNASISFSCDSGNRKKSAISHVDTGNYGRGDLVFSIDPDADSGELDIVAHEKLRILSTGRIGIGTNTAPRDMVHIHNPTANASSYIQFTNANTAGTGINDGTLIGISQNNSNTDGTGSGFTILNKENAEITLGTNGSEKLRISKDGALGIAGANYGSSGQVLTSQGGSAAPQWATAGGATVQSGSWTPAWTGHSGTPSAVDTAYGKYTRIGELVFIECYIKSGTRGSATGAIRVSGLPFDLRNDTHDQVLGAVAWDSSGSSIDYSGQNRADHVNMIAWIPNNTGYIRFAHQTTAEATAYRANNAGSIDLNWIICGSSSGNYLSFRFSGCYRTDA